jgi:hypothetical protein
VLLIKYEICSSYFFLTLDGVYSNSVYDQTNDLVPRCVTLSTVSQRQNVSILAKPVSNKELYFSLQEIRLNPTESHRDDEIINITHQAYQFQIINTVNDHELVKARVFWNVNGPDYFALNGKMLPQNILVFEPDLLGSYIVQAIVQDENNNCISVERRFGVTHLASDSILLKDSFLRWNNFFKNKFSDIGKLKSQNSTPKFKYLDQIKLKRFSNSRMGRGVKIALLDSGIAFDHPELILNLNHNRQFKSGWNFVDQHEIAFDDSGHGTAVAGLAVGQKGGVAPGAQIIPIRVLNVFGEAKAKDIAAGIFWAIEQKVDIILAAFGESETDFRDILKPSLDAAEKNHILIITSAGNHGVSLNSQPQFPACSGHSNILTVTSLLSNGELAPYSNYGENCVDIAAPGGDVNPPSVEVPSVNFAEQGLYVRKFGTSLSVGIVGGIAALIKSKHPEWKAAQIKAEILKKGIPDSRLEEKVKNSLRL